MEEDIARKRAFRQAQFFTRGEVAGSLGITTGRLYDLICEANEEGLLSVVSGGVGKDAVCLSSNDVEVLSHLLSGHRISRNVVSSRRMAEKNPMHDPEAKERQLEARRKR